MERFSIKINSTTKKESIKRLCRLCGVDNPNKIPILTPNKAETFFFDEPDLCKKILVCVGIEVNKNDRMPHDVCPLCCDKINDFYEYREMCAATNIQTRILLGLPEISKNVKNKKRQKTELVVQEDVEESILGVFGDEIKPVPIVIKNSKTSKQNRRKSSTRKVNRTAAKNKISSKKLNLNAPLPLLTQKAPNRREIMREKAQRTLEKKHTLKRKRSALTPSKKVKFEAEISCSICSELFPSSLHLNHLMTKHLPNVRRLGCSSCGDSFDMEEESKAHHDWHRVFNIPYQCIHCANTFDRLLIFTKHMAECMSSVANCSLTENILCHMCNTEFVTENLYNWHECFIKSNTHCPKCQRFFTKRTAFFQHLFKCGGTGALDHSKIVVEIPVTTLNGRQQLNKLPNIKTEPEAILDSHFSGFSPSGRSEDNNDRNSDSLLDDNDDFNLKKSMDDFSHIMNERILRVHLEDISPQLDTQQISELVFQNPQQVESNDQSDMNSSMCVKEEPVDYDECFSLPQLPVDSSTVTIKKEISYPSYNDFDVELARNIKNEHADRDTAKPPRLRLRIHKEHGFYNSSIVSDTIIDNVISEPAGKRSPEQDQDVVRKRYKKPALLALKMKQDPDVENIHNYLPQYPHAQHVEIPTKQISTFLSDNVRIPVISNVNAISLSHHELLAESTHLTNGCETNNGEEQSSMNEIIIPIKIKLEPLNEAFIDSNSDSNSDPDESTRLNSFSLDTHTIETGGEIAKTPSLFLENHSEMSELEFNSEYINANNDFAPNILEKQAMQIADINEAETINEQNVCVDLMSSSNGTVEHNDLNVQVKTECVETAGESIDVMEKQMPVTEKVSSESRVESL